MEKEEPAARKNMRWARGLNKDLVDRILEYNPSEVEFKVKHPTHVECYIRNSTGEGIGLAICSVLDEFDEKRGKNKAAGRALKALVNKKDNDYIRLIHELPNSWTMRQARRLEKFCNIMFKSEYVPY